MIARPGLKMLYTVAGRTILVDTEDAWAAHAVSKLFARWFLTPLSGNGAAPPDASIRIRSCEILPPLPERLVEFEISLGGTCHTDGQILYLDTHGSLIVIGAGSAATVDVWLRGPDDLAVQVISQAFSAALRRCGLFELHSGGVIRPEHEKAMLIVGASGSGKSTLTLQLVLSGWKYLSDDVLLLNEAHQGIEARGLRRFFALTPDTIAAVRIPQLPPVADEGLGKERFTPEDFFPSRQVQCAQPDAILFPVITHEATSRLQRLTASEAMARLLKFCPWSCYDRPTSSAHLRLLGRLARETVAFNLYAGADLLGDPARTADLAHRAYVRS
ncbi:MAG: hypothetical protein ACREBG_06210 [Pyrinomonadaceae bacterium]